VRPSGPLRVNNGEALLPALIAGIGIGDLPEFICGEALASGGLEAVLTDWSSSQAGVYLVTPPGGPRPARMEVLLEFLAKKLGRATPLPG
jgi:DNA-binding transcriptional LysR family regulator